MRQRVKLAAGYGGPVLGLIVAQAVLPMGLDLVASLGVAALSLRAGYLLRKGT